MPVKAQQVMNKLGLEATEEIVWQGWQPGGEYTKSITLKNVDIKTKKLKYRIPSSRFFTTKYPQPIILSSGTSMSLPVTFRPLEKGTYEDKIIFETKDGKFAIQMMAVLPVAELITPDRVEFYLCAVGDMLQKSFEIINISELGVTFTISCAKPFSIKPSNGYLKPRSRLSVTVEFKPEAAYVYQLDATCKFGDDTSKSHTRTISLHGTGKYAYIGVRYGKQIGRDIHIDFKDVAVNTTSEKIVELVNHTPVSAPFQVLQPSFDASLDKAFKCSQYHGIVPGNRAMNLRILYTPRVCDVPQADSFEILALGATSRSVVKCIGQGKGPMVYLDDSSISFGITGIATEVLRAFKVVNTSKVDAVFQFQIDNQHSVFNFDVKCGKLKAGSSQTIKVIFKPERTITYCRRVTCLIHNQEPIYVDLFGTCHSDLITPAVLQKKHLDRYRTHICNGLSRIPPEDLRTWLQEEKIAVGADGCLTVKDEILKEELYQPKTDFEPSGEFFSDGTIEQLTSTDSHVAVDVRCVEFSRCTSGQVYHKTINVTNHTQGKVLCFWNTGVKGSPFTVQPSESDISPLQSVSFSIRFKPTAAGQFFFAELEGFVFYKSLREHYLVEDAIMCPPWCVTVRATGHTFSQKSETFLPQCDIDSLNTVFAPVTSLQPSYKTFLLTNYGKNPVDFSIDEDETRTFSCKPAKGLLRDKYQIIVFRFLPDGNGSCSKNLKCRLNIADKYAKEIQLTGSAETPELQIQAKDIVYFQPTYVGTTSDVEVAVRNPCRVPLRFEWKILTADKEMLSVCPSTGLISPNESQWLERNLKGVCCVIAMTSFAHTWTFKPNRESKYLFKAKLIATSAETNSEVPSKQTTLRLLGEGQTGSLSCHPDELDLGDAVIGNSVHRSIQLQNESDCGLHYELNIEELAGGASTDDTTEQKALEINELKGFLPARSRKAVELKMIPRRRCQYECKISCKLMSSKEKVVDTTSSNEQTDLCTVKIRGVYPTLNVTDVRGTGCAQGYSRRRLWELFSIDRFNICLDSDPGSQELMYPAPTRHSTRRRMPIHTRAVMDFNFGSSPHMSDSCNILINLQNTGTAAVEWTYLFPTDLQLDMEFWAQTGEFDDDELHEMFVLDHSLFSIHPKSGNLTPGESQIVSLSYSHSSVGIHRLPVLFKVTKGREILGDLNLIAEIFEDKSGVGMLDDKIQDNTAMNDLNFIGNTIPPDERYLHFSTTRHMFSTVPIGRLTPFVQTYPLHNGGGQPLEFQLDLSPLDEIQEQNCGWRIFECLNPSGQIKPGETAFVSWIFSPLEAKTYSIDIMVHVTGGESTFVTFTGIGYDPSVMGPTMSLSDSADDGLPKKQLIPVAEQLLYLSEERISFDNAPVLAKARRLLIMKNVSDKYAISFRWLLENSAASEVMSIHPSHGYIEPLEFIACKVTFLSKGPPEIYDLDCICEVTNETLMAKYNKELLDWHHRQEEKKLHFTITESDLDTTKNRPGSGPTKLKSIENSKKLYRSESDLRKYGALPPIGSEKTSSRNTVIEADPQPKPPKSFVVHLGVAAKTHSIEEFYSNFIDLVDSFFIRGDSSRETKPKIEMQPKPKNMTCTKEEFDTIESIVPLLIKDLLDDKDFKETIEKIKNEPVPYFGMLDDDDGESPPAAKESERQVTDELKGGQTVDQLEGSDENGEQPQPGTTGREDSISENLPEDHENPPTAKESERQVAGELEVNQADDELQGSRAAGEQPQPGIIGRKKSTSEDLPERPQDQPDAVDVVDDAALAVSADEEKPEDAAVEETTVPEDIAQSGQLSSIEGAEVASIPKAKVLDPAVAERQKLKSSDELSNLLDEIFDNTIFNLISEASRGKINLTARPRLIALPPSAKGARKT